MFTCFEKCQIVAGSHKTFPGNEHPFPVQLSFPDQISRAVFGALVTVVFSFLTFNALARDAADTIGVGIIKILSPDRGGRELTITLWYPALTGGNPILLGDSAVFEGSRAWQNAPIAQGRFPVLLLAFGGLRSASHLDAWLAARLAGEGFLVASIESPKIGQKDAKKAILEIGQRPLDLSYALTALTEDPLWSKHMDAKKVAALGFFLGGTSVLSLAGGRLDGKAFQHSCDTEEKGLDCLWFKVNGVDWKDVDVRGLTGSSFDPRIGLAIAIDPEYSSAFIADSLTETTTPMKVINLGDPQTIAPGLNAARLSLISPSIVYTTLSKAARFDAFNRCKPAGSAILREEEGDDAICRDGAGERRTAIHDDVSARILSYLQAYFR